jgi:two-component system, cell cycle sensor histidine kinase and response regulator CckA
MNLQRNEIVNPNHQDDKAPATPAFAAGVTKGRNPSAVGGRSSGEKFREVVLVVNDLAEQLDLIGTVLQLSGYNFITAMDGYEGYEVALAQRPDLIISDVLMPRLDGIQMCHLIRAHPDLCRIPILLVSAFRKDNESVVEGLQAGADDYMEVPFDPMRLIAKVSQVIERRHAEKKLLESEERCRDLIENAHDLIYSHDLEGNYTSINKAGEHITGYRQEEVLRMNLAQTVAPEYLEKAHQMIARKLAGEKVTIYDLEILAKDGRRVAVEVNTRLVYRDGVAVGVQGIARDITERKRAEAALREAEEKYRSIFENAVEGIFQSSCDGRFIAVNPAMARILGYASPEELIARRTDIEVPYYVDANCRSELEQTLAEQGLVVGFECEIYRKDLSRVWTVKNIRAIRDEQGAVLYYEGSIEDITERKTLEEQLRQAQKMEAIGQLAGGIAHDFNNLLTAIGGYSEISMTLLQAEDPLRHNLEEIKKAGDRAAALTHQLLAFSRKQVLQPKVLDLNSIVSELEKMLRRLIGEDIELCTALNPELGSIKADPGQIEQVIMNLSVNARDAMPQGGKLTIATENVFFTEEFVGQHGALLPGAYVMLAVSDTGTGIDEKTKMHLFEPFFTTKEVGRGTGLGLSTVYGIVRQSGGNIWIHSEIDQGTTFKIYLPLINDNASEYKRSPEPEEFLKGSETILLAEDEEMVRHLVRDVLKKYGYEVLEVSNGGAALLICEHHQGQIDLLVTDVIMPEVSGRELENRLRQVRPDMKVLFMSGYMGNSHIENDSIDSDIPFLQKPFTTQALVRKVREVLQAAKN